MFPVCILHSAQGIVKWDMLRRWITDRLKDWKKGLMTELVQCVVAAARHGTGGNRATDGKSIACTFHLMIAQGKLCSAVCMTTSHNGGNVYVPEDTDTKLGRRVINKLRGKHPKMMDLAIKAEGWMSFEN